MHKMTTLEKEEEDKNIQRTAFIYIIGCIFFTMCIFIFATYMPSWMKIGKQTEFVKEHILPLSFFTSFSFILGILSLLGVVNLLPFIETLYANRIVDLGVISIIAGFFSIFIGSQFKKIVENLTDDKIQSSMKYDVIGFTLGRMLSTLFFVGSKSVSV